MKRDMRWLLLFSAADLSCRFVNDVYFEALGPAQPFLALKVGVTVDKISIIWVCVFGGMLFGSVLSAVTFKRLASTGRRKLAVFAACAFLTAASTWAMPNTNCLAAVLVLVVVRDVVQGYWTLSSYGIPVQAVGPVRSRVVVSAQHLTVAVGFVVGSLLVGAYFPRHQSNTSDLCDLGHMSNGENVARVNLSEGNGTEADLALAAKALDNGTQLNPTSGPGFDIAAPFHVIAVMMAVTAFGYVAVFFTADEMPVYLAEKSSLDRPSLSRRSCVLAMALTALFMAASCGSERVFQTFQFTFGLCGELRLTPDQAVKTDVAYSMGFLVGRIFSLLASFKLSPSLLLWLSVSISALSALLVSATASWSLTMLAAGAFTGGLGVSGQYAAAFSWLAEHVDVTGFYGFVFPLGCMIGSTLAPLIAASLFKNVSHMAVWHLNAAFVASQGLSLLGLSLIVHRTNRIKPTEQFKTKINNNETANLLWSDLHSDSDT